MTKQNLRHTASFFDYGLLQQCNRHFGVCFLYGNGLKELPLELSSDDSFVLDCRTSFSWITDSSQKCDSASHDGFPFGQPSQNSLVMTEISSPRGGDAIRQR